jgi:hypothetical protein
MLRYALICDKAHAFEGWFRDSAGFDVQASGGLLTCPACGSSNIAKAIMAPNVARRDKVAARAGSEKSEAATTPPETPSKTDPAPVALLSDGDQAARAALGALHRHVRAHSRDVGKGFAKAARDMHEGAVEHASIHGVASAEEVRALYEDGIEAHLLPSLPDDAN